MALRRSPPPKYRVSGKKSQVIGGSRGHIPCQERRAGHSAGSGNVPESPVSVLFDASLGTGSGVAEEAASDNDGRLHCEGFQVWFM